ncbi:MAG: acetylornithine deacetylase [Thalassobius sp.]|nr:acetylornithine deacetylase [Thalassovita sp.]
MTNKITQFLFLCFLVASLVPAKAQKLKRNQIESYADAELPKTVENLITFLSIPNDAQYPANIKKNIEWLNSEFSDRGFEVELLPTAGEIPIMLASTSYKKAEKTVLMYFHADGQAIDSTKWFQPHPYKPVLKAQDESGNWEIIDWNSLDSEFNDEWRVFGRSASDAKGPIIMFLSALDAMKAAKFTPDFNLKIIIDFEEEQGSPNLPAAVTTHKDKLAADMLVIFDGPPHITNKPTLTFGARGISDITLTTYGPRVPQHSGHYGNYAPNPALRLSKLLASMKDEEGRVTIPGFYDGITLDEETKKILGAVPDDEAMIQKKIGIAATDKVGNNYQESIQYPSLNIRGLQCAWVGKEARTIVPATATAEIDMRLVPECDPEKLISLIKKHIESQGFYITSGEPTEEERMKYPKIVAFKYSVSYAAFRTDFNSEIGNWLSNAYVNLFGEEPVKIRISGGSIPISPFVATLDVPAVTVPNVNPDNNQHSPNENLRLGNLKRGVRTCLAILAQKFD